MRRSRVFHSNSNVVVKLHSLNVASKINVFLQTQEPTVSNLSTAHVPESFPTSVLMMVPVKGPPQIVLVREFVLSDIQPALITVVCPALIRSPIAPYCQPVSKMELH